MMEFLRSLLTLVLYPLGTNMYCNHGNLFMKVQWISQSSQFLCNYFDLVSVDRHRVKAYLAYHFCKWVI